MKTEKQIAQSALADTPSISWSFDEHTLHQRGFSWYLLFSLVSLGLLIHAFLTANWLFALIIIMVMLTLIIRHRIGPVRASFTLNENGIRINEKLIKFQDIEKFWIIYNPETVKNLYFTFKTPFHPKLVIPFEEQNPVEIRSFLRLHLEEDLEQEDESLSDLFSRILKI